MLSSLSARIEQAHGRLNTHLAAHSGYVAWSGGRDSTAVVDLARQLDPRIAVVWFDSGLELPDTAGYLQRLAEEWNLNFHVYRAEPDALSVLAATGAWDHAAPFTVGPDDLHDTLITAPSQRAHREFGPGEISGLRAEESVGRRALLAAGDGQYSRRDGSHVCAPIWPWDARTVRGYLAYRGVPEHPAYDKFACVGAPERARRVGLAVDGNNPDHGRFGYLRLAYPDLWSQLVDVLPRLREWR